MAKPVGSAWPKAIVHGLHGGSHRSQLFVFAGACFGGDRSLWFHGVCG